MAQKKHSATKPVKRTDHKQHNTPVQGRANKRNKYTWQSNNHKRGNVNQRGGVTNTHPNDGIRNSNADVMFFTVVAVVLIALATCLYLALQPHLSDAGMHLVISLLIVIDVGLLDIVRRINK